MSVRARCAAATAIAVVALANSRAYATEPAPVRAMTLEEATAYARAHQPALHAAVARFDAASLDSAITRARWNPTFAATAQLLATTTNNTTGSYVGVPLFDNPRVSATRADNFASASLTPQPSSLVGLGARQQIFDFGRIAATAAAEDLRADAERFSVEALRIVIAYDVAESYFAVFAAKRVLDASERAIARETVHRDMAKAGVESGLRRPIELTRAEAEVERYELRRIQARRGVAGAQSVFAAAVGVQEGLLDISGTPPQPRDVPGFDQIAALAERTPELRSALARVRAQEASTRAISTDRRPTVFLTASASLNAGGATPTSGDAAPAHGVVPTVPNWDVGVVLSWPLFDSTVSERERRSHAEEEARRQEVTAIRRKLVAEIDRAYIDVQAAREAIPVLERSLAAAVANYDQANARFDVGLGNAVELADAEELRTDAEIQLALGTFELARARAAFGRAIAEGQ